VKKKFGAIVCLLLLVQVIYAGREVQGGDVSIGSLSLEPPTPTVNEIAVVKVSIAGPGKANPRSIGVRLLVDGEQIGYQKVDLEGGEAEVLFQWIPRSPGTHRLSAELDRAKGRGDESNVRVNLTVEVSAPKSEAVAKPEVQGKEATGVATPSELSAGRLSDVARMVRDIVQPKPKVLPHEKRPGIDVGVTAISIKPREPVSGEVCEVLVTVANLGKAPLWRIPVRLLVDGSQIGPTQYIDNLWPEPRRDEEMEIPEELENFLPEGVKKEDLRRLKGPTSVTLSFSWIPENFGHYSLVAVAGPVHGERVNQVNNFASLAVGIPLIRTINIEDRAVTTTKIADEAVTAAKLALDPESLYKVSGGFIELLPASPGRLARTKGTIEVTNQENASIYLRIVEPAENYTFFFNNPFPLYFSWEGRPRITFAHVGSIYLENSIYYLGAIYQAGVRGIPTEDIRDFAVTNSKLADAAVISRAIADLAVTEEKIAPSAVTTTKIADRAVTSSKLADAAVLTRHLADLVVTTEKLAPRAVTTEKIGLENITTELIAAAAVTTSRLADLAVTEEKIAPASVTSSKLADAAVLTRHLADLVVTAEKLAENAVTSSKISENAVGSRELALDSSSLFKVTGGLAWVGTDPNKIGVVRSYHLSQRPERMHGDEKYLYYTTGSPYKAGATYRVDRETGGEELFFNQGGDMVFVEGEFVYIANSHGLSTRIWKVNKHTKEVVWEWVGYGCEDDNRNGTRTGENSCFGYGIGKFGVYGRGGPYGNSFVWKENGSVKWTSTGVRRYPDHVLPDLKNEVVVETGLWSPNVIQRVSKVDGSVIWRRVGPTDEMGECTDPVDITDGAIWVRVCKGTYPNISFYALAKWDRETGATIAMYPELPYDRIWHVGPEGSLIFDYPDEAGNALVWNYRNNTLSKVKVSTWEVYWTTDLGYPLEYAPNRPYIDGPFIYLRDPQDPTLIRQFRWKEVPVAPPKPAINISSEAVLKMGKGSGMRIYLYGEEAGIGVEPHSPARVYVAADSVFSFRAPATTERVRFDYTPGLANQGIYYTGGLYYGLDAVERGIPTEDIRNRAVTREKIAPGVLENIDLGRVAHDRLTSGILQENIHPSVEFARVENAEGGYQFSVTNADRRLRFGGRGAVTVLFDPTTHSIIVEVPVAITQIHAENGLTASRVGTEVWIGITDGGVTFPKLAKEVRESIYKGVSAYESFPISQENISSKVEFVRVENAEGGYQFSVTNENRGLRFKGTGAVSISFDPTTHMIMIHAEPAVYNYYTTNYYTTNNYYGPRLWDVSNKPRVEYLRQGSGISITYDSTNNAGIIGIASKGVTSWMIADQAVGNQQICDSAVTKEKIADAAVNLPKINWEVYSTVIASGGVHMRLFRHGYKDQVWEWGRIPIFFGRPATMLNQTWDLSDFGTGFRRDTIDDFWWEWWLIKNVTGGDREIKIVMIKNPSPSAIKSKLFFQYHADNGEIMSVSKADHEIFLEQLPANVKWYLLDNHPLREEIYNKPSDFVVDLKTGEIRRRS
jgi:hypothetical protein